MGFDSWAVRKQALVLGTDRMAFATLCLITTVGKRRCHPADQDHCGQFYVRSAWHVQGWLPSEIPRVGSQASDTVLILIVLASMHQAMRARSAPSVGCEDSRRFEMVSKEKYLQSKQAASTQWMEAAGGIRFCDLKIGAGVPVERGLLVGIHFEGFRLNGKTVESSWPQGLPLVVEVGCTPDFPALGEGIVGMCEGGRRELVVPPRMNRPDVEEVMTYIVELIMVDESCHVSADGLESKYSKCNALLLPSGVGM